MKRLFKALLVLLWLAAGWLFLAVRGRSETGRGNGESSDAGAEEEAGRGKLKRRLLQGAALLAVLGVGGFLVAASGIIPIKASSGHWAITRWLLSFSMSRSVATHSLGIKVPPLEDARLVLKGAGHYETGCRPCHGTPSLRYPRIALQMTPHPPYLPEKVPEWEPEELFYIVKHGVKFTGMPAWPARQRDDEVWAVVAFLLAFPEMDAEQYQRLVAGPGEPSGEGPPLEDLSPPESAPRNAAANPVPSVVADSCRRCHGPEGLGRGEGAFPRLAGQRVAYLAASLQGYALGTRHSGIMEPIAAGLSTAEIRELAGYYAALDPPPPAESDPAVEEAIARGEAIAHRGIPAQKVPACAACHGPSDHPHNPNYPLLAGQYAEYLKLQLELFKKQHRGGSQYAHLMHHVAGRLTEDQMRDAALYYASLTLDRS